MAMQQTIGILAAVMAFAGTAACHPRGRTPQAPPAVAPDVDRRRAMDLFHRGDFRRAQTILQRVTFELTPGTPELAPSYGETALAIYQELAGRFPDSDAAARGRVHVRRLENQFAEKTYKTGIFYLRRKAFDSAIIYFKDVIANYPTTDRAPDALLRLVDSYRAIRYTQELDETCEHLRRFYPNAKGIDRSCPAVA